MGLLSLVMPTALLLAWLAARRGVLENPAAHRRTLTAVAAIGLPVGWLGGLPSALVHLGVIALPEQVAWMFTGLQFTTGLAAGLGYVALFALLALRWTERRPLPVDAVAAVGKRSLTFYLFQSLCFAPLLSAWGLGLGAHLHTAGVVAFSVAVWLVSLVLAHQLEKRGRRGPAEVVLRRLTYGRRNPVPRPVQDPAPAP